MNIKKKITVGFVIQTFVENEDGGHTCTEQEFIAGDQVDFEDEVGEPIDEWSEYQEFDMVQPQKMILNKAVQRLLHHAVSSHGLENALSSIEGYLTKNEYDAIEAFLQWMKEKERSFGWDIADVVADWEKDVR